MLTYLKVTEWCFSVFSCCVCVNAALALHGQMKSRALNSNMYYAVTRCKKRWNSGPLYSLKCSGIPLSFNGTAKQSTIYVARLHNAGVFFEELEKGI